MDFSDDPIFGFEKLDVYRASISFVGIAQRAIRGFPRGHANLADQLSRAAGSITLNVAEGSGEYSPKEKARFYRLALRSAGECVAAVDVAQQLGIVAPTRVEEARGFLRRIVAMLTAMIHQQEKR